MLGNLFAGARYVLKGLRLLSKPRVKRYVVVPLLINTLLFSGAIVLGVYWLGETIERLIPTGWEWLTWVVWPLFALLVMTVIFFGFMVIANLIGAPFNGMLAAAVETHLSNRKAHNLNERGPVRETLAMFGSELRKLVYIGLRAVPCLLLFLVPGAQIAAPFIWFLFGAWMLTIEYADYPMGNHGLSFPQQRKVLSSQRAITLGFGIAVMALTLVPILNFLAMPAAVAGATAMWVERLSSNTLRT